MKGSVTLLKESVQSINAHAEQEEFDLRRTGDTAEIQEPCEVQTNEEAQVYVHDLDLF